MVTPANTTLDQIKKEVRSQVGSPDEQSLTEQELEQTINLFVTTSFPAAIKTDQLRDVYTIFTKPNVDLYPFNVNMYQSVRAQAYVEGRQAALYKDRGSFFQMYPRQPQIQTGATGNGTQTSFTFTITGGPILPTMVVIGTKDINDNVIRVVDDGGRGTTIGNLVPVNTDLVGDIDPPVPETSPIPP